MMAKTYTQDMTKGNPMVLLLKFTWPMLIGNLFQQLYSMVDTMVVGQFVGSNELGAVGSTGSISFLIFSLSFGLANGIGIIISQFFGANEQDKVKKAIATSFYVMGISAILTTIVGVLAARPVMELLLYKSPELVEDAVLYLQITCLGALAIALYNGVAFILRGLGDSKTPLIFLIAACFMNIILDLLFVIVFDMEVLGVALATVISQVSAAVGCIAFAWIKVPVFRMPIKEYVPDKGIFVQSIKVGVPVSLQSSMIAISCVALQGVVNGFGATIISAFTVVSRFEQLVQQPFNSLASAVSTYTGQNIGAGNIKRVKEGFWAATTLTIAFSLCMLPVAWFGADVIMRFFVSKPEVIQEGARGIRITCFFYSILGMIYVARSLLNGSGDVKFAMYSGFIEIVGRVGFAYLLALIPGFGVLCIWFTSGLTWSLAGAFSCIRYALGGWKEKSIVKRPQEAVIAPES